MRERRKRRDRDYESITLNESREVTERRGDIRAEIDSLVSNILNRSECLKAKSKLDFSTIDEDADTGSFMSDDESILFK